MRRWILVAAVAAFAGLGYTLWPFLGLYQLGDALHSADADGALRQIDVSSVRLSIIHQILDEGTKATKIEKKFGDVGRRLAVEAATTALNKRVSTIITRDVLRDLITEGHLPASFAGDADRTIGERPTGAADGTTVGIPDNPLRFIQSWDFKSFKRFEVVLGDSGTPDDWTGLTLRRKGFTWRLTSIRLSNSVMSRVKPIIKEKIDAVGF